MYKECHEENNLRGIRLIFWKFSGVKMCDIYLNQYTSKILVIGLIYIDPCTSSAPMGIIPT